jgi:hypothetical protein
MLAIVYTYIIDMSMATKSLFLEAHFDALTNFAMEEWIIFERF